LRYPYGLFLPFCPPFVSSLVGSKFDQARTAMSTAGTPLDVRTAVATVKRKLGRP
jgi:hypothetical protein